MPEAPEALLLGREGRTAMQQVFEGTWEEVVQYAPQLAGRRVRVTVLTDENGERVPPTLDVMLRGLVGTVRSREGEGTSRLSELTGRDMAEDLARERDEGRP